MKPWSNLASVVYQRTYSRSDPSPETYADTVERVLAGNFGKVADTDAHRSEKAELRRFMLERKGGPAGRGFWYSGTASHARLGGAALNNCWFLTLDRWENWTVAMDLLMLGGGVGASIERRFTGALPRVREGVAILRKEEGAADYEVFDSREGSVELLRRVLESFFVTGRSFTYSTRNMRPRGSAIRGFGGKSAGALPLNRMIDTVCSIISSRSGERLSPLNCMDMLCAIGEMIASGNVRRSAIIILGDPGDEEFLAAKRWDLGPIPNYRAFANLSVVCSEFPELGPAFWNTYEHGEPFGIINRKNIQRFGRIGEESPDTAIGVNPCAEATLENFEACNLQEIVLSNLESPAEFFRIGRLLHRYGKRVTLENYHVPEAQAVIQRNRRVGTGITGCLESPLFRADILDAAYGEIQAENRAYSAELGIPPSIRTTVVKPSGTLSKMFDAVCEGIHPAYSRHYIQRIRLAATDGLVPILRAAGHPVSPVVRFDGSQDPETLVVDFYRRTPAGIPVADEDFGMAEQLGALKLAQRHWADQSVSVTVYYRREELPELKLWLERNLGELKTISFLCHSEHGFRQAPKEAISADAYEEANARIRELPELKDLEDSHSEILDCEGGGCPVK